MQPIFDPDQRSLLLRTLFDHACASMAAVLVDGTLVMFNRNLCEFLGYSETELLRLSIFDLTFPEDRGFTAAQFHKGSESAPASFQYEKRYLRKDGKIVWGLVSGAWVLDGRGTPLGVALIQDITARKEAEIALQEQEKLYRTLVENIDLGFNLIGEDRRILKVNNATSRLLGKSPEDFVGLECFREFEKRDRICEHCPGTLSLATGKPAAVITEGVRDDGTRVIVRLQTFPVPDQDGRARKFVEVIEDITDKVEARDALRESERRFRAIFENAAAGMYTLSPQGRFLQVNRFLCRYLGYTEDELLRLDLEGVTCPDDRPLTRETIGRSQAEPPFTWHYEKRYRHKDGSILWGHVSGVWQMDDAGLPAYGIGLIQDITERKRSEQSLHASENRYRRLFEANPFPMWIFDRETLGFLAVNDAAVAHYGYSRAEFLSMTIKDIRPREDVPLLLESLGRSHDGHFQEWARHQCRDGRVVEVEIRAHNIDFDGRNARVVLVHDVTEKRRTQERIRRSEERLEYLANHDALTDLPKRQLLESVLQHALERVRREKKQLAVLIVDLDHFKAINQSFGHRSGDELLVAVVQRLRGQVRKEDALSRLGGDQFALVLEGIRDYSDVEVVARNLQGLLDAPFVLGDGREVYLRGSIGISVFPQDGATVQELLHGADAAISLAKERGGNQFCYCTAELNAQARMRSEIQAELHQALERGEFVLHYQPKVDLRSGRIVGAEALLRWNSPGRGLVSPLQIIPLAEKNGFIVPLGAWVIEAVCRQMRKWEDAGLAGISVAVNVSARQFRSGNLEELVSAALQNHRLEPHCLMLELTESMLMDDPEEAIRRITGLRRIGVRISLDDFGTGYSSLGYLGRLPLDQLKIDRSFITDIVTDPNAATIASSVIALAHRMRLRVVAEGVETEAQLGYLRRNGCDEMQGFYFSKPVPAEEFAVLVRQGRAILPQGERAGAPTLLLVDDEPNILTALRRLLFDEGYRILTAGNGRDALEILARSEVQVIVSDQRMPEMSGTEFLKRVKALHPNTVRLILSGYADLPTVTESVNAGALYKFIAKPWDDDYLREQIREAFEFYETNIKPRALLV